MYAAMMIGMMVGSAVSGIVIGKSSSQVFLMVNMALAVTAFIVLLFLTKPNNNGVNS
jgi:predicted MFS family arabinose efflux permease